MKAWGKGTKLVNPEELGSYYGGDMLVPNRQTRNVLINESYRWRNAEVPYVLGASFSE